MSVIKPALQRPDLIAYFSGANNYCWLFFRNGEKKLLAKPISYLESKLPDFIRVHKTALINPAYVKSLHRPPRQKMAGEVRLENGVIFPVSRRRWSQVAESLQYHLEPINLEPVAVNKAVVSELTKEVWRSETVEQSILLITNDETSHMLAKQAIEAKWPAYPFQWMQRSAHLFDLLKQLPVQSYPVLLLLDARTQTLERLHTLQRLKEDSRLGRIPVILLVTPTDQSVTDGYKQKANSVISMPDRYPLFAQTVERICQFWLHTVALPSAGQQAQLPSL